MEIAELIRKKELEEREELRRNAERRRNAEMEGDEWAKATDFRFWSMELRRKRGRQEHGRLSVRILHTLYRYLSGYGEQIGRALGMLVALWLVFGLLYTRVGFVRAPASSSSAPRNGRRGWDTSQTD